MGPLSIVNKIKDGFGLRDSLAVFKVIATPNPPQKYYSDVYSYEHSGDDEVLKGVRIWWQGGNTSDKKETIEVIFHAWEVSVDQIIEHFKKHGLYTELLRAKIKHH